LDLQSKPKACPNLLEFCPLTRRIACGATVLQIRQERLSSYESTSYTRWKYQSTDSKIGALIVCPQEDNHSR
jgi:hypothetical protein